MEKWKTLSHNGPTFSPNYHYQKHKVVVKGIDYTLNEQAEEVMVFWAQKINTDYVKDPVFQTNFWNDFKKLLNPELQNTNFPTDWDFTHVVNKLQMLKEAKLQYQKNNKELIKKQKEELKEKHGYAIIDGRKIELLNYVIEPPGIFMGRPGHPMRGKVKFRINPEDVTINIDENSPVPEGNWKAVVHNRGNTNIAFYYEKATGQQKDIMVSRSSAIVQDLEKEKFDLARKLANNLNKVNDHINKNLTTKDAEIATVCKLISTLCIRVGDEKGEDTADTVGASTLRKEHIKFNGNKVTFDFLGKDSIPFKAEVTFEDQMIKNLQSYWNITKEGEQLFPNVTSVEVKEFLNRQMIGISAKTFRTANASKLMSEELKKSNYENTNEVQKLAIFNDANLKVALKLNHRSAVPKTYDQTLANIKASLQKYEDQLKTITIPIKATDKQKAEFSKKQASIQKSIDNYKAQIAFKEKTKGIALGTSRTNYIDPRVIISWCKEQGIEVKKLLTAALIKKFEWAMEVEAGWYRKYVL